MTRIRKGVWLLVERMVRWSVNPRLRAGVLRLMGARIGKNVRIYESMFFNLTQGFRNLEIEDDVHVGSGCLIDLDGRVLLSRGSVISPGVALLTHSDPGSEHGSPLVDDHPPTTAPVVVGEYAWIGTRAVVLAGRTIGHRAIIAAGAVVTRDVPDGETWAGVPARRLHSV